MPSILRLPFLVIIIKQLRQQAINPYRARNRNKDYCQLEKEVKKSKNQLTSKQVEPWKTHNICTVKPFTFLYTQYLIAYIEKQIILKYIPTIYLTSYIYIYICSSCCSYIITPLNTKIFIIIPIIHQHSSILPPIVLISNLAWHIFLIVVLLGSTSWVDLTYESHRTHLILVVELRIN